MRNSTFNFLSAVILSSFVVLTGSCKKDPDPVDNTVGGCTDADSPLYNGSADYDDNSCLYAYVTSYEISYHPEQDGGSDWDLFIDTDADLMLRVKEQGSGSWMFESATIDNQAHNAAATWSAPSSIKLLNKTYEWDLYDEDTGSGDDFIASGTFNPIELAASGVITTTDASGSTQLKLYYNLDD